MLPQTNDVTVTIPRQERPSITAELAAITEVSERSMHAMVDLLRGNTTAKTAPSRRKQRV